MRMPPENLLNIRTNSAKKQRLRFSTYHLHDIIMPDSGIRMDEIGSNGTEQPLRRREKNRKMYLRQMDLLDIFPERDAISKAQHDKSLDDPIAKMETEDDQNGPGKRT